MSVLSSPMDMMAVIVAIFLDAIGLIAYLISFLGLSGLGEPISSISDIAGAILFTAWSIYKGGGIISARKNKKRITKLILSTIGESIPLLPLGALPFWTIFVVSELRSK